MDIQKKDLSLKFYSFLCDVIGDEEVVFKRRQIFAVRADFDEDPNCTGVSTGSRAEGLDLTVIDTDQMYVDHRVQVYERLDQIKSMDGKIPLIMDTEDTKAGFTKLLTYYPPNISYCPDCIDMSTGFSYLSSTLMRQKYYYNMREASKAIAGCINGPCTTNQRGDIDITYAFHCSEWISQALPWVMRTKYSWASDVVVQNILSFGVYFVPIGSKKSPHSDLEWRISFNFAEKLLIFSFNHIQLICYALLKILLNDIIKKIFGDLVCSYFMKTIMFWLCEETHQSYWRVENLLSCFMTCFRRLVYCVENKTCLHYFIPENNLFEHRFETQHSQLLSTLHELYDIGWTCLLQTETLQSFKKYLDPSLSFKKSLSTCTSFFSYLMFLHAARINNHTYNGSMRRCLYQTIRSREGMDIYMYLISGICQSFAQNDLGENLPQSNNRFFYKDFRRRLSHLMIGVNHDAVSGWLLLASFYFTNKHFKIFKTIIGHCFTKFTPERYELFGKNDILMLQQFIEHKNVTGLRWLRMFTINMVKIVGNCSIIPGELNLLLDNKTWLLIPSLVYAHFLNFYFYHTVGDDIEKRKSYRNLLSAGKLEIVANKGQGRLSNYCVDIAKNIMHANN